MTSPNIYFVGGEVEAFVQGSDSSISWSTNSSYYDANFSRGAVTIQESSQSYLRIPLTSPQASSWTSLQSYRQVAGNPQGDTWMTWLNGSGQGLVRLQGVGGTQAQPAVQFQYWTGSAWAALSAGSFVCPTGALHKFDVQCNFNATTGAIAGYIDGVPVNAMSGNTAFVSPATLSEVHVETTGGAGFNLVAISEVQILDVSTLGRRLATLSITGAGGNSAWTGAYTDINEVGTYNDGNFIQSGTANQVSTFTMNGLSTQASTYAITGLIIAYRVLEGAVGPQNMQGAVRLSGANYFTSNITAPSLLTAFGYTWASFPQNPATSAAWTPAQINAGIEAGAQSIT